MGSSADRYIRLFNRLEAAVRHHELAKGFHDEVDDALYAAARRIVSDAAAGRG